MVKRILLLIVLLTAVFTLYYPIFSVYFSHDDFFHFKVSQTDGTLGDFLNLFGFHPFDERGIAFYRPIFREGLFNIFYSIFGLNHLPFRILSLTIHLINITLIYFFMQKSFGKKELSFFTAFFFGITAGNVGGLYYLAGGIQSLGATMFMLATLLLFWKWLESKKIKFIFLSLTTYLLSLGSHELAVVTPLVLLGLLFVQKRLKTGMKATVPFFVVLAVFLYLDFFVIGFSSSEQQYQLVFSIKTIINSLAWYSAWALGIPEMFIDFVGSGFSLNPNLMKFWGDYAAGIFFFGGSAITILVASMVYAFRSGVMHDRRFWFLLLWFPLVLSPVIILPLHKSTYYLTPALPAFWGLVGVLTFSAYNWLKERKEGLANILGGAFLASLFLLTVASVALTDKTYPAANRGRIAERLIKDVGAKYPVLPKGATVYFKNDPSYPKITGDWGGSSKQAAFVLNNSDALQLLYKDPTLRAVYEDFEKLLPENGSTYSLVARLQ